jgi:serine/threonine-protein kinase
MERCPVDGTLLEAVAAALAPTGTGEVAAAVMPPSNELAPGTMVGEYEVEKLIGEGGMGMVYGARHPLIGKRAAIKVLHAAMSVDREGIARFIQEAQAVNKIGHANIVDIFSFGTMPDGRAYFVMEWLQGHTLNDRIERGQLPISDAAAIMLALVRALEAAHAAGVIHRDLKPENVFLVSDDDSFRVKLLDFGIAKLSVQQSKTRTATGMTYGTPLYMSPEQARGTEVDARTDLYSLGVVCYEMLCGKTPFDGEASAVEVLHAHLAKLPRPPRDLRPDIARPFEDLILELLAKRAEDRPTLVDVRQRLAHVATRSSPITLPAETVASRRISDEEDVVPPRRRTGPAVAVAVALAIMGGVAFTAFSRGSAGTAVHAARPQAADQAPAPAPIAPPVEQRPPQPPAPAPAPVVAMVDLTIEPATASAALDGTPVTVDHGHVHLEVDPGVHAVTLRAAGYRPLEQKIDAAAGKRTELTLRLLRLRSAAIPTATRPVRTDRDGVVDPFNRKR